mmetsp:Transcript_84049/g.213952  ORF Transcript_84049/g.213952 Transcript_84049/m.213952 type:complete len:728 (+) Transcript_84049:3-2186(+)
MAAYSTGDDVFVFYRMTRRCTPQRKYLAVLDPRQGSYRPRNGISDGWLPAKVVDVEAARVKVEYSWRHFATCRGHFAEQDSGWAEWYPLGDVRAAPPGEAGKLAPRGLEPELILITFRWGGNNEVIAPDQWGDTGSSVSDLFVDSFVERAVMPMLGNNYEVWTVYVEDHTDMLKVANAANLIFGPYHPARRGRHVGAMYHLYPTSFEENCVPSKETGSDGGAALVDQKSFFKMQQAVERAGVPTRFPHPSGFYELLSSKRWTYMMSLTPHLRVPPTVSMPRMQIEQSCSEAAKQAIIALNRVKQQQAKLRNEPPPQEGVTKGVAKLGFSWEALDVKFWEGQDGEKGLTKALHNLTQNIEISDELTGQPQDLEAIIVQEYCKHDLEARLYVVDGKVETTIYTKFCKIKDNLEFGDFHELFDQEEAANQWCGGDLSALQDGERQCQEIAEHWMVWVQAQICAVPPAIRFDFFVGRGEKPGEAVVWTLEICELGFSMLGEKELPNKVFAAMFRSCMGTSAAALAASASDAAPLPSPPKTAGSAAKAVTNGAAKGGSSANMAAVAAAADAAEGGENGDAGGVPSILHVTVPPGQNVTKDQHQCSGKYTVMPGAIANDAPVWINDRGDRFMYHGNDDNWYVGDEEEQNLNFDCDQGYIRHDSCGRVMPHLLAGDWERGEEWLPDAGVGVSTDGSAPPASARRSPPPGSKGKGKVSGKSKNNNNKGGFGKGSP